MRPAYEIVDTLETLKLENTFNPYADQCPVHDVDGAPKIRREYLREMLRRAEESELDAIWVGRDLGYRGGRRTGLALTDDVHFSLHLQRWGLEVERPTKGDLVAERTAAVIWEILLGLKSRVFLWNVFPLHPFVCGEPFSNRAHNARERAIGTAILLTLIRRLRPKRVVTIGNDAHAALARVPRPFPIHKVRHPSYGGQTEFLTSMRELYRDELTETQPTFF